MIGVIGFGNEAVDAFAQQALFVAEGKVHLFHHGVFSDRGVQPLRIDHHAELLQIMRVTELMQRKSLIDRRRLAHDIDRAVDGFLCQFQRERRFRRDLLRQRHHKGRELGFRHHVIDHAEPVRFLGESTQTNISRHLKLMYDAKLLSRRKEGTLVFYKITSENTVDLCRSVCTQMAIEMANQKAINPKLARKFTLQM